jgi:hypothetical protein
MMRWEELTMRPHVEKGWALRDDKTDGILALLDYCHTDVHHENTHEWKTPRTVRNALRGWEDIPIPEHVTTLEEKKAYVAALIRLEQS